jgi:hypothetical protein
MASMIYEGLLGAIPGLKVVVAHGGGYFPPRHCPALRCRPR